LTFRTTFNTFLNIFLKNFKKIEDREKYLCPLLDLPIQKFSQFL
ncbi:hypothetical protein HMPREF0077_1165, partial [Anaerococcus tetradius ATCC 35098]